MKYAPASPSSRKHGGRETLRYSRNSASASLQPIPLPGWASTASRPRGDDILTADVEGIRNILCGRYRFWRIRPNYIVHTRDYLHQECALKIKKKIESLADFHERRDFFADNPGIKGLGYKEASHFLRNIGFEGYAILDIHVVRLLHELGILPEAKRPANRKQYVFMEEKMREFSKDIKIANGRAGPCAMELPDGGDTEINCSFIPLTCL